MKKDKDNQHHFTTQAIRYGKKTTIEQEHSEALFLTSSFVFDSAEQAAARFSYQEEGNVYSRFSNPSVASFERKLAQLEGGQHCVATASGMSALLTICMTLLQQGDHVVSANSIFGASRILLSQTLHKFGVTTGFVGSSNLEDWRQALTPNTKLVFFETPTNPLTELIDIAALSELVHSYNPEIKVVVDNCFCTPALQQPLKLGADVVIHSTTKSIDGQGRCIGGAIVGDEKIVGEQVYAFMRTAGPSMSPFNAWVFNKGLETLALRMKASSDNAMRIAECLSENGEVEVVYYPGLPSHPQHALAKQQQRHFGAVLSFSVKGGRKEAWQLIDRCDLLSRTANLGDTRTTITHPYTTTHARWSNEQKQEAGIKENLIRLSIGLEDYQDIIDDLGLHS